MQLLDKDGTSIAIAATPRDFARLAKLLEWIVTEQAIMDESNAMLEPGEIYPAVRQWLDFLTGEALA